MKRFIWPQPAEGPPNIEAKQATFTGRIFAGVVQLQGSLLKFREMMSCMDDFDLSFNIVTP